jgi:adenosylhomocysteine nucleosidase
VKICRVGIVVALPSESRTWCPQAVAVGTQHSIGDQALLAVSGVGEQRAAQAAQGLVDAGVAGLVSWGCAAGLAHQLHAGALCLPEVVVSTHGQRWPTDATWRQILADSLGERVASGGALAHAPQVVASHSAKRALAAQTGAVLADMESAAIAQVAHRHGLPLLVVRSVVDPLELTLPAIVTNHIDDSGRVPLAPLLRGLVHRPGDLLTLLQLARGFRASLASLRAVRASAGDNLLLTHALTRPRSDATVRPAEPLSP